MKLIKNSYIKPLILSLIVGPLLAPAYARAQSGSDDQGKGTSSASEQSGEPDEQQPESTTPAPGTTPTTPPPSGAAEIIPRTTDARDIPVNIEEPEKRQRGRLGKYQLGLSAGGGVSEFSNTNVKDITDVGGAWNARVIVGTRSPVGFEAAYIGTANRIETLGLDRSTLLSNGAEGDLRVQIVRVPLNQAESVLFKPYVFGGFAWKHYSLQGASSNTSSVNDKDNVYEVPFGGGLGWNFGRFLADQRFDFRPAFDNDLIRPSGGKSDNSLQNWSVTARVGVEF